MPVSHLGLTVSHIPSATSFYLAALAPLGYRYIGQSGDSVGLGIEHADLFLTQEPRGKAVSPAHVAFDADSRLTVRNCYAAALSSGGYPSGAPSYRDRDCSVFNAAIEDLDGNVIEFIHKELSEAEEDAPTIKPVEQSGVLNWQKGVASSGLHDDTQSMSSRVSRGRSRADTVKQLLSSVGSRSTRTQSEAPSRGLSRAQTMPTGSSSSSEFPSKALFGTLIGLGAAGALAWTMFKSEDKNAREEAAYTDYTRSRSGSTAREGGPFSASVRSRSEIRGPSLYPSRSHRNFSTTESHAPSARSHRNYSTTESAHSRKYPPSSLARSNNRRAIAQTAYHDDESMAGSENLRETISRFTASRRPPALRRSRTTDAIEYAPVSSNAGRRNYQDALEYEPSERSSHHTAKRSALEPNHQDAIEYNPERSSHHTADRSTTQLADRQDYYIEGPKPGSATSRRSERPSRHESRQPTVVDEDQDLKRRDSGISMGSPRSHHSRHSRAAPEGSHRSSASTLKPSRREPSHHESAADVPLPASKAPSHVSRARDFFRGGSSHHDPAADVPLPASRADTHVSRSRESRRGGSSHHDPAADVALPASKADTHISRTRESRRGGSSHYDTAADVPLPASKAGSYTSRAGESRRGSSHYASAHEIPLPASRAGTYTSRAAREQSIPESRAASYVTAAEIPTPESRAPGDYDNDIGPGDESDGIGDKTVVPDDSISCIDFRKPPKSSSGRSSHSRKSGSRHDGGSRSGKRTSEAASDRTLRPPVKKDSSRNSAATLPVRGSKDREEGGRRKRSVFSHS